MDDNFGRAQAPVGWPKLSVQQRFPKGSTSVVRSIHPNEHTSIAKTEVVVMSLVS